MLLILLTVEEQRDQDTRDARKKRGYKTAKEGEEKGGEAVMTYEGLSNLVTVSDNFWLSLAVKPFYLFPYFEASRC